MTRDYLLDCLFDLINESELLNVSDVFCAGDSLHVALPDGSRFRVCVLEEACQNKKDDVSRKNP